MNWPVVTATPLRVNVPAPGRVVTFTASRAFAGDVARIAEAKIDGGEDVGGVLVGGHRIGGAHRRIVDGVDVDGQRPGGGIQIDAAVAGAAVVLDLEGERGIARAIGVGSRGEHKVAGVDVRDADELAGGHGHAIEGQRAGCQAMC